MTTNDDTPATAPITATRWVIVSEWEPNERLTHDIYLIDDGTLYTTYDEALVALRRNWRTVNINRIIRIQMTVEHVAYGWDTGIPGDDDGMPLPEKTPIDPALTRPAEVGGA